MITFLSVVAAAAALVVGIRTYQRVVGAPASTDRANEVAQAISEGATIVRIGTAIFGPRNR